MYFLMKLSTYIVLTMELQTIPAPVTNNFYGAVLLCFIFHFLVFQASKILKAVYPSELSYRLVVHLYFEFYSVKCCLYRE